MGNRVTGLTGNKRTSKCLRMHQVFPIGMVEIGGTLAGELEMLLLVMANGDMSCPDGLWSTFLGHDVECIPRCNLPVNEDIRSLENGIGEEA